MAGELVAYGEDICLERGGIERPYDSAAWNIPSRTYYFQGPFDPATPMASARYHFSHQKNDRTFVTVPTASHKALTIDIVARGCADAVWSGIFASETLESAVSQCSGTPITVETAR